MSTVEEDNVNKRRGAGAVIISAVIAAATSLAGIAAASLTTHFTRGKKSPISGDFENRTKWDFIPAVGCSATIHGHWGKPPQRVSSSWLPIKALAESEGINYEKAAYLIDNDKDKQNSVNDVFYLMGNGWGGESLAVFQVAPRIGPEPAFPSDEARDYHDYPSSNFMIALYMRKLPSGKYFGGIAMGNDLNPDEGSLVSGQGIKLRKLLLASQDEESSESGAYILISSHKARQSISWDYSFIDGKYPPNRLDGQITVSFTPGENITFEVDYQSPTEQDSP